MLGASSVEVGTPNISGSFDIADFSQIAGGGRAAANDATPKFRVDVNGVALETFTALVSVEGGMTLQRFVLPTPPLGVSYNNVVTLFYIDPHTGNSILVATKVIGPLQATIGSLDLANSTEVAGWAFSPSDPTASVVIRLLIDNVVVASTTASLDRPDLTGQLAGHAYVFNVPPLLAGTHIFSVRFRDPVTGDDSVVNFSQTVTTT